MSWLVQTFQQNILIPQLAVPLLRVFYLFFMWPWQSSSVMPYWMLFDGIWNFWVVYGEIFLQTCQSLHDQHPSILETGKMNSKPTFGVLAKYAKFYNRIKVAGLLRKMHSMMLLFYLGFCNYIKIIMYSHLWFAESNGKVVEACISYPPAAGVWRGTGKHCIAIWWAIGCKTCHWV